MYNMNTKIIVSLILFESIFSNEHCWHYREWCYWGGAYPNEEHRELSAKSSDNTRERSVSAWDDRVY